MTDAPTSVPIPAIDLPDGRRLPVLGLGTWRFGEDAARRGDEEAAIGHALELGYRLIDTAEMYGDGGAETVVGAALARALRDGTVRRDEVCVVSKVYPHNASRRGTRRACDASRRRLGLDRIDLYLLHWRGSHPLADTVAALRELVAEGAVGGWGVSNFDVDDMEELQAVCDAAAPAGRGGSDDRATGCQLDQVYFSVTEQGPAHALLPWLRARGQPLMAYSPIDQGRVAANAALAAVGRARGLTAAQVALAWAVAQPGVCAIPKATGRRHLADNRAAASVMLAPDELAAIAAAHPPPRGKRPLAMI